MPHALIVDDDEGFRQPLGELVKREGFSVATATSLVEARASMEQQTPDLILTDLYLGDGQGIDLLTALEDRQGTEVVLITGHASVDTAVEALRHGASDYLTKPVDLPRLRTLLANVKRAYALRTEVDELRTELRKLGRFGPMIGSSTPMQKVYDLISRVAPTDATVLITGESGTGKELVAQTVHQLSRRNEAPFLPVNCGAIAPNLIESELFGHERGSFTGADRQHRGLFERASGGTVFLDEITEMPIELQVKLLRVLETGTVQRIGGEKPLPIDVRVLAASNRDPGEAVAQGKLREDLLYRLKVFPLLLPPLRDRGDDIELLTINFLAALNQSDSTAKRLHPAAMRQLREYRWPGNVRELRNVLQQAFIMSDNEIGIADLPADIRPAQSLELPAAATLAEAGGPGEPAAQRAGLGIEVGMSIDEADRRLILATLTQLDGDKRQAAEMLGISLKTLYNKLKAYQSVAIP